MSELPPGLVWKWNIRSCFSQTSKHSSASARVSSSHVPGSGLPPSRNVVFSATTRDSRGELERLARHLGVARQERDPDRGQDAVVRRRRVHHDVVEVERELVDRHAVVGHRERPLDLELVHVVLDELLRVAVVVDRRLHRVLEVVELPRRDLADVAVRVDDLLAGGWPRSAPSERAARLLDARLPFLAGVEGLRRHQRRLVEQPRAVAGSSWTTSSVNFGRAASSGSSDDACSARPLAHVHLQPVRAERRDVLEQDDPLGAARAARARAARARSPCPARA